MQYALSELERSSQAEFCVKPTWNGIRPVGRDGVSVYTYFDSVDYIVSRTTYNVGRLRGPVFPLAENKTSLDIVWSEIY